MGRQRPICAGCSKRYGRRDVHTETVRWATPLAKIQTARDPVMVTKGPIAPPPPYRGDAILVKDGHAYLSADTHEMVMQRELWDGVSWISPYEPFCTLRCALRYARAAYNRTAGKKAS